MNKLRYHGHDPYETGANPNLYCTTLWVWKDSTYTQGTWCLMVTTYVDYWDDPAFQNHHVDTGLVPVFTLENTNPM